MLERLKSALAIALCASTAIAALPSEVLAGPLNIASPTSVGLSGSVENIHYRRYHRRHYRYYGYDPAGAAFAGAALGIMAAGVAAASRPRYYYYGYPVYYGYPGYYGW